MGTSKNDPEQTPLIEKTVSLLHKAGYEVIFPKNMKKCVAEVSGKAKDYFQ
jgi:D-lactate dehydrogenase